MNMFKKSCWGLSAVAVTAGVLVWGSSLFARPPAVRPGSRLAAEVPGVTDGVLDPGLFASTPATGPVCESTGFEAVEGTCGWEIGWICGSTFTSCVADGDIPGNLCTGSTAVDENCCADNTNPLNGWYVSISSQHCFEPHVDTANPASGTQHLRFQRDPSGGVTCESLLGACRDSAFSPTVGAQPITPTLISFDLSLSGLGIPNIVGDGELNYFTVSTESNSIGPNFFWTGYNGYVFVYDQGLGGYEFTGYYLTADRYAHFEVDIDPCSGVVNYTMDNLPIYSHNFDGFSFTVERMLMTHNNGGIATWDLDNYSVVRGEACPTECGNLEVEAPEQCEEGFDECCPGLCIAPGEPGECSCAFPAHSLFDCDPEILENGANGPFLTHGGFFSYTPDTPFTSVDTCGSDYDTEILWDISPDCGTLQVYNDECSIHDGFQTPGDPSAPCYLDDGNFPGASCVCQPTTPGVPITFVVDAYYFSIVPPFCSNTIVNISKKFECGVPIAGGACCDLVAGSCSQADSVEDCSGENMVFSENKDCTIVDCTAITAACCDSSPGAGGACSDTTSADCAVSDQVTWSKGVSCSDGLCAETPGACCYTGPGMGGRCDEVLQGDCPEGTQVSWTKGLSCADAGCVETTGACCNTLEGTCTDDILSDNCSGDQRRWNKGASCSAVSCNALLGACCDTGSENPTIANCSQTTEAECNCAKCGWTKLTSCEEVDCFPNFDPIPTVSSWGMAIMTLLLLVAGKVYFGRRQSATA